MVTRGCTESLNISISCAGHSNYSRWRARSMVFHGKRRLFTAKKSIKPNFWQGASGGKFKFPLRIGRVLPMRPLVKVRHFSTAKWSRLDDWLTSRLRKVSRIVFIWITGGKARTQVFSKVCGAKVHSKLAHSVSLFSRRWQLERGAGEQCSANLLVIFSAWASLCDFWTARNGEVEGQGLGSISFVGQMSWVPG